jgi:hypothetical protein
MFLSDFDARGIQSGIRRRIKFQLALVIVLASFASRLGQRPGALREIEASVDFLECR